MTAITTSDLIAGGFTPEQIERLMELRAAYPYIEFVESHDEWQRLVFLKWRYGRERALTEASQLVVA
jgi:hypothetical protein